MACPAPPYQVINGRIGFGYGGNILWLQIVPTHPSVAAAYKALTNITSSALPCPPWLLTVATADDHRAFAGENLVLLADQEIRPIAQGMLVQRAAEFRAIFGRAPSPEEIYTAISASFLAHEFGHALRNAGAAAPFPDEEANADWIAGVLDAKLGKSLPLGMLIFVDGGWSTEPGSHPAPAARAQIYRAGYQSV